jgi:hypothetical protein
VSRNLGSNFAEQHCDKKEEKIWEELDTFFPSKCFILYGEASNIYNLIII